MPDTAPARHAGNRDTHGDHRPSSRSERERHFGSDVAHVSHVTIPGRSLQPLCYFLGEKVTQKHFHTAAPLGRQYESAFARSRGGYWWWTVRCIRSSQPPPEGRCPCRLRAAPQSSLPFEKVQPDGKPKPYQARTSKVAVSSSQTVGFCAAFLISARAASKACL